MPYRFVTSLPVEYTVKYFEIKASLELVHNDQIDGLNDDEKTALIQSLEADLGEFRRRIRSLVGP